MDLKSLVPFRPRSTLTPADVYPFDALRREVDGLFFDFARALGGECHVDLDELGRIKVGIHMPAAAHVAAEQGELDLF